MGKKRNKTPIVNGREEQSRIPVAQTLLNQGKKDFESVYGSKEAHSFSVANDQQAVSEVFKIPNEFAATEQTQENFQPMEDVMSQMPQEPVQQAQPEPTQPEMPQAQEPNELQSLWLAETNGEVSFDEWLDAKKNGEGEQLSEDPEKRVEQVAEFLSKQDARAPNAQMLKSWRHMHGDIFLLHVSDRVFIYRYLKRQEWIQINANPKLNELTELQMEEDMFNRCVLYPQMDMVQKASLPAGAVSMIVQQIRLQSLFLDPSYVSQLTIKI